MNIDSDDNGVTYTNNDNDYNEDYTPSNAQIEFPRITQAEARLKNDLVEFENKRMTTKQFKVILSDIIIGDDKQSFLILCDFEGLFKILIKIKEDYPFSYPDITYHSGCYCDIFESNGKIKLPFLSNDKWSPVLSLNSILFSIELLLLGQSQTDYTKLIGGVGQIGESIIESSGMEMDNECSPLSMIDKCKRESKKKKKKYKEHFEENKEYMDPNGFYYSESGEVIYCYRDVIQKMKKLNVCMTN